MYVVPQYEKDYLTYEIPCKLNFQRESFGLLPGGHGVSKIIAYKMIRPENSGGKIQSPSGLQRIQNQAQWCKLKWSRAERIPRNKWTEAPHVAFLACSSERARKELKAPACCGILRAHVSQKCALRRGMKFFDEAVTHRERIKIKRPNEGRRLGISCQHWNSIIQEVLGCTR